MEDRSAQELATLYREIGPMIYRHCQRLLRDEAAAEDAAQEVFLKLAGNLERLRLKVRELPWIYRTATNHCLNLLRDERRRRRKLAEGALELRPGNVDAHLSVERQLPMALLGAFDRTTQAVAVAVLVDGMEQREVAQVLGVSTKTVSRKLVRFVARARELLQGEKP